MQQSAAERKGHRSFEAARNFLVALARQRHAENAGCGSGCSRPVSLFRAGSLSPLSEWIPREQVNQQRFGKAAQSGHDDAELEDGKQAVGDGAVVEGERRLWVIRSARVAATPWLHSISDDQQGLRITISLSLIKNCT